MKKVFFLFCSIPFVSLSQQSTVEVYKNNNGINELTPSKAIVTEPNGDVKVYNYTNGMREIFPTQTLVSEPAVINPIIIFQIEE